jgi:single-stranded-DNA-specific exonuclease
MVYDRWDIACPDPNAVGLLTRAGYGPLAARTLVRRGIGSPKDAEDFFTMRPDGLFDPFLLPDMQKAVDRLRLAAGAGETVAVYGDYDADGVTATAIMVQALRDIGLNCVWHIPDRERDGYGLNSQAIHGLRRKGASLIVTVDTGTAARKEVAEAKELGLDVIITDHHECQGDLPGAVAVVNPRRPDSAYPFCGLAGVGVAFKLVCALTGDWRKSLIRFADLVALGTIADIMPVTGENRILITQGLKAMAVTRNIGLQALLRETEQQGKQVTAETAAFILSPRINAAGRLGRADAALGLLLTQDPAEAEILARQLCQMNSARQVIENDVAAQAAAITDESKPALVLAGEGWPVGVIGIVAARLAEQFERPAFIACIDGDVLRGSARGVPGINLAELLGRHSRLLEACGGHSQAAGFTVRRENFDAFRQAVYDECAGLRRGGSVLEIDAEIDPEWLDLTNLGALEKLAPFGAGFAQPVFALRSASALSVTPIGGGKHLRILFECGARRLDAVWFNKTKLPVDGPADIAFRAEINRFRGSEKVQLRMADARESVGGGENFAG